MDPVIRTSGPGTIWRSKKGDVVVVTGASLDGSADTEATPPRGLSRTHFFHLTHSTNPGDPWSMGFEDFLENFDQLHPHEVRAALRDLPPMAKGA